MNQGPGRLLTAVLCSGLLLGACGAGVATAPPTANVTAAPAAPTPVAATPVVTAEPTVAPTGTPTDLLAVIKARGKIIMSTDPEYPPQSSLNVTTGKYEGFDIDIGTEIATRLGVAIDWFTPGWTVLTAGSWVGRWDFSVGSMTITSERQKHLDFTQPYYYTPAQMTARTDTGITTTDGLAGKTVCVGVDTTYQYWLQGTLDFGSESPQTQPPAGAQFTTLATDRKCPEAWKLGRHDSEGWLSSSTTVDAAITDGLPVVKVGEPVFYEPLAVAIDKSGAPHAELLAALDKIVGDMHADGTLTTLSMKWFGADLTKKTGE